MTDIKDTSYNLISKLIHWVTALLILGLIFVGFYMADLEKNPSTIELYMLHKSFGLIVLILACVRITWHLIKRRPESLSTHKPIEKFASHAVHAFLYVILFVMPLSGWIMSSAGHYPVQFFGFPVPDIVPESKMISGTAKEIHETVAILIMIAVGLHIAGAYKHHFIDKDATLARMAWHKIGVTAGTLILLIGGGFYAANLAQIIYINMNEEESAPTETTAIEPAQNTSFQSNLEVNGISEWEIDKENSHLKFTITEYKKNLELEFENFDGKIFFDPAQLDKSHVQIIFDIPSVQSGDEDHNERAVSEIWFNTKAFPTAVFESSTFEDKGNGDYLAKGTLNLKGIIAHIDFPFHLTFSDTKTALLKSTMTLSRLEFGVGAGEFESTNIIGDDVQINVDLKATQK